ncbi:hypothetical protein [uncultured Eudoraea sp.]|uniref:hypothetical protein n=1 Tax=uncultured Eudoraea sp. TaxID=1035614 RepID=UPI002613BDF5|nr:hypothetical protein [uncultured Eudoraea sp.]
MKKITVTLALIFSCISVAQKPNIIDVYHSKSEQPLVVINGDIIAGVEVLKQVQADDQIQLVISKDDELSPKNLFPLDKKSNGIIYADLKVDLEVKTQVELNSFFGLDPDSDIYINGYLLEDKEQKISTRSIKKIELRVADGLLLKSSSLNITIE